MPLGALVMLRGCERAPLTPNRKPVEWRRGMTLKYLLAGE